MKAIHVKSIIKKQKREGALDELIYNITVDQIHLDRIPNESKDSAQGYPAMTLCYDERNVKRALQIAKESESQEREPEVYIHDHGGKSDLIVIFRVEPISTRLLRTLMPKTDRIQYQEKLTDQTTLILVAGGTIPKDARRQFWDLYVKAKWFSLNVALRLDSARKPLWGIRLATLIEGSPRGLGS